MARLLIAHNDHVLGTVGVTPDGGLHTRGESPHLLAAVQMVTHGITEPLTYDDTFLQWLHTQLNNGYWQSALVPDDFDHSLIDGQPAHLPEVAINHGADLPDDPEGD